jgi:hypothetical protein
MASSYVGALKSFHIQSGYPIGSFTDDRLPTIMRIYMDYLDIRIISSPSFPQTRHLRIRQVGNSGPPVLKNRSISHRYHHSFGAVSILDDLPGSCSANASQPLPCSPRRASIHPSFPSTIHKVVHRFCNATFPTQRQYLNGGLFRPFLTKGRCCHR